MGLRRTLLVLGTAVAVLVLCAPALAATIKVNTIHDDFGLDMSKCSLREAIQAANTDAAFGGCTAGSAGSDTIQLRGGNTYVRDAGGGVAEDNNAAGDFDVKSPVVLAVKGKGLATIDAGGLDRVFQIFSLGGSLTASRIEVTNGDAAINQPTGETGGGGILNDGVLKLTDSVVSRNETFGNTCNCGGGVEADGTTVLKRDRLTRNSADNSGGGVGFLGGHLKIHDSTIDHNTGADGGGGIDIDGSPILDNKVTISGSTISSNRETSPSQNFGGGGIAIADFQSTPITATNVTIAGNQAGAAGGGIYVYAGLITLNAATIVRNVSDAGALADQQDGGGGIAGSVVARNSIVAVNRDLDPNPSQPGQDDCGPSASVSDGLVGKDTGCLGSPVNIARAHIVLGNLANNGGSTKTISIPKSSPAVDAATKPMPERDQRGRKRDHKPDIGAFERGAKR